MTTNPSLVSKENRNFIDLIKEICTIVDGPISAEVTALDSEGMVKEARGLAQIHENITVKVPMTLDGLKATRQLSSEGIKTNMTLVFSPSQAILAAKAGATFVSPFIGRLDDIGQTVMEFIEQIVTIFTNDGFESQGIVFSIRQPNSCIGSDIDWGRHSHDSLNR